MATSKSYFARASNYRFLSSERDAPPISSDAMFELDESDVWNSTAAAAARSASPEVRRTAASSRVSRKLSTARPDRVSGSPASLPVNVPDWSKILKDEYRDNRRTNDVDDDDELDDGSGRVPPHEFLARQLARTRIASFSVHEGIGRTLKGRDLSRVRNAIWEKTGFED